MLLTDEEFDDYRKRRLPEFWYDPLPANAPKADGFGGLQGQILPPRMPHPAPGSSVSLFSAMPSAPPVQHMESADYWGAAPSAAGAPLPNPYLSPSAATAWGRVPTTPTASQAEMFVAPFDEAAAAEAARTRAFTPVSAGYAAAMKTGQWGRRGTKEYEGYTAPPPAQQDESELSERRRLNFLDSYYRGTLFGAGRLALLAHLDKQPDDGISPATRRLRDELRTEYRQILADLERYDSMPRFQNRSEFGAAALGQLGGGMLSPESMVGLGAKGVTWLGRTLKAGLQQGAINAATDPIVQLLNIKADAQEEYDPWRTAFAGGTGFVTNAAAKALAEGLLYGGRKVAGVFGDRLDSAIYDPPSKPARPFEADYPDGASSKSRGRLEADVEGRPLVADHVVGRNVEGGSDQPLPRSALEAVAEAITGRKVRIFTPPPKEPAAAIPGGEVKTSPPELGENELGRLYRDWLTGTPSEIVIRDHLTRKTHDRTLAHEIAHAIDRKVGTISTWGLWKELREIYNTLNNPARTPGGQYADPGVEPVTPRTSNKYGFFSTPREYMVEAIRAYLTNPNYIKTVAPETAARIRKLVNAHPELSKIIQFNAAAGAAIIPQYLTDDARANDAGAKPDL